MIVMQEMVEDSPNPNLPPNLSQPLVIVQITAYNPSYPNRITNPTHLSVLFCIDYISYCKYMCCN